MRRFRGYRQRFSRAWSRRPRFRMRRRFRNFRNRKLNILGIKVPATLLGLPFIPVALIGAYFLIKPFKEFVDTKILKKG